MTSTLGQTRETPPERVPTDLSSLCFGDTFQPEAPVGEESTTVAERLLEQGTRLANRYELIRKVGAGGMGVVYEARDLVLNDRVALKFLSPKYVSRPDVLRRMHREVVLGRKVTHPNVCRIYDLGTDEGVHFLSMEFVDGRTLEDVLATERLDREEAMALFKRICEAVSAAHEGGIVHRDLKPGNVMITPKGVVKVMDFGLACDHTADTASRSGVVGTPAYWAPEQARGEQVTPAADVYALGVTLFRMLSGELPSPAPDLSKLPRPLRAVVARAMAVDAADRPANAGILCHHLQPRASWGLRGPTAVVGAAVLASLVTFLAVPGVLDARAAVPSHSPSLVVSPPAVDGPVKEASAQPLVMAQVELPVTQVEKSKPEQPQKVEKVVTKPRTKARALTPRVNEAKAKTADAAALNRQSLLFSDDAPAGKGLLFAD